MSEGKLCELGTLATFITWVPSHTTGVYHRNTYQDPDDNAVYDGKDLEPLERGHQYRWAENVEQNIIVFMPWRVLDKETVSALRQLTSFYAQPPFSPGLRGRLTPDGLTKYGTVWQRFTLNKREFAMFKHRGETLGWEFIAGLHDVGMLKQRCSDITHNISDFMEKVRVLRELVINSIPGSVELAQVLHRVASLRVTELVALSTEIIEFNGLVGTTGTLSSVELLEIQQDMSLMNQQVQLLYQIDWDLARQAGRALPEASQNATQGTYVALGRELAQLARAYPVLSIIRYDAERGELVITLGNVVVRYDGTKILVDGDIQALKLGNVATEHLQTSSRLSRVEHLDE